MYTRNGGYHTICYGMCFYCTQETVDIIQRVMGCVFIVHKKRWISYNLLWDVSLLYTRICEYHIICYGLCSYCTQEMADIIQQIIGCVLIVHKNRWISYNLLWDVFLLYTRNGGYHTICYGKCSYCTQETVDIIQFVIGSVLIVQNKPWISYNLLWEVFLLYTRNSGYHIICYGMCSYCTQETVDIIQFVMGSVLIVYKKRWISYNFLREVFSLYTRNGGYNIICYGKCSHCTQETVDII